MNSKTRKDCYTEITNAILADLENGIRPWVKPWETGAGTPCRPLRNTGEPYRGINVLWLWSVAARKGYLSPYWLTYKQAHDLGAHVRKGEKSSLVVYASLYRKTEDDDAREPEDKKIPFLKAYSVFNAEQIENIPERFAAKNSSAERVPLDIPGADRVREFLRNTQAKFRTDNEQAYYSVLEDTIYSPPLSAFPNADRFYSTLAHELTHWTGHPSRLPRKFPRAGVGLSNYAREELIAELGAAFLCADLGVNLTPRPDHADYIGDWLQVLRNDKRAIFHAAAVAQQATDYLHAAQPEVLSRAA